MKREATALLIGLAFAAQAGPAQAGQLSRTQEKLNEANRAARHHAQAARASLHAAHVAQRRQAALVAQEIAATATLRTTEARTARIAGRLAALTARSRAAKAGLDADAAAIAPLLPLIARLALHPAATFLAADAAPGRAVEGALVMRGLTREIASRATALRAAEHRYAALSARLATRQTALTQAVATQQAGAQTLQADIAAVRQQEQGAIARHAAEAAAAAHIAATAHDLAGVIARLRHQRALAARQAEAAAQARARTAAARIPPAALPRSLRHAPVAGSLIHGFGAATAAGPATGDTFAAAPGATVSAACTGHVVFARPFQSYGKLLILDCGGGNDFVMAGFHSFAVKVGQPVRAGQPVGTLPAYNPRNPANRPRLYVELRHDGTAIDPAGHFAGKP